MNSDDPILNSDGLISKKDDPISKKDDLVPPTIDDEIDDPTPLSPAEPHFEAPPTGPLPVFFDQRRRRWRRTKHVAPLAALAVAAVVTGFVLSLVSRPLVVPRSLGDTTRSGAPTSLSPVRQDWQTAVQRYNSRRVTAGLRQYMANHPRGRLTDIHDYWRPTLHPYSIVAAFYVNWEAGSYASFEKHASQLTHLIPEWLHLDETGAGVGEQEDSAHQFAKVLQIAEQNHVYILPLVNNFVAETATTPGYFDPKRTHKLLTSARSKTALIQTLLAFVQAHNCAGVNIDFEELSDDDGPAYVEFIRELSKAFHRYDLLVTVDVQDDQSELGYLASAADYLVPMLYDQHSSDGPSGPIAAQSWYQAKLAEFFSQVPPSRTILGLGNYAYDWTQGVSSANELSVGDAVVTASESEGDIQMDNTSLNSHFAYYDDNNKPHDVWMLDALSAYNQLKSSQSWEPAGAALWVIGEEDRALWSFYSLQHLQNFSSVNPPVDLSFIPGDYAVDRVGQGEVLDVTARASNGKRTVALDQKSGLITSEKYLSYPSPWVIHGEPAVLRPKELALTFDDGPDSTFTPQILDVLSSFHVPATFFLVGDNADKHPDIVHREWNEGHELGDHTFFHPNLVTISPERIRYEVEATERLIEVLTGHSTHFFRAPYVVDTDPDTPEEVAPLVTVRDMGFLTVGSNIDPKDYEIGRTPTQIVNDVMAQRGLGNIILMHDAGGDRNATVAALKILIPKLQAMGYKFVSVSALLGGPGHEVEARNRYFPVAGEQAWSKTSDYLAFMAYFWLRSTLSTLFVCAIILGLTRVVFIGTLALWQARMERRIHFDPGYQPMVSVLIAAYNEEKVIARTLEAALRSTYTNLEVIVVDDGSGDNTSAIVTNLYGSDPRVRLIRKPNGGKASALNLALDLAKGEIMVGIDADTSFMPTTVAMLVRHFEDPAVGGVAGNVKVGNPVNLLTRWQSLEYITGQNFDRRAYGLLNCITVVPGAVGAWRKASLIEAGGYLGDTLAEDTDLTYRVRRLGYQIRTDSLAIAYTEAPETLRDFQKQRIRWTFGTLQCIWKHRDAMFRYGAFGWVALPSLWFYSILLPLISPAMDVMIVWSLFDFEHTFTRTGFYYGLFFLSELLSTIMALALDGEGFGLAFWLFFQRFFYRQLMYVIVWKALLRAWAGTIQGWGKLARTGRAQEGREPERTTTLLGSAATAAAEKSEVIGSESVDHVKT